MTEVAATSQKAINLMLLDPGGDFLSWTHQLSKAEPHWQVDRFDDPQMLLARFELKAPDAVFLSSSIRGYAELNVLNRMIELKPDLLRFQLGPSIHSNQSITQRLELTHRVFAQPNDIETICTTVKYLLKITQLVKRPAIRQFISNQHQLPAVPGVYLELTHALNSDTTNAKNIASIIQQDPALAAKLIQLVNSSYFGMPREISQIPEAVSILGIRTLRGLALSSRISSTYPPHKRWKYFSFERINQRALLVARLAKDICQQAKVSPGIAEQAFLAGLLQDIGILVMASQNPSDYLKVLQYAVKEKKPLHLAEKKITGLYHGEVGAALMALWNIPPRVVEAILLHPAPHLSTDTDFQPLTAVHVADALIPPVWQHKHTKMNNQLSEAYLEKIGYLSSLHHWKLLAHDYRAMMKAS